MSITDRASGQALAIFALSLTAIFIAAALAFDAGALILERRDQQNAADAAAMAGARYVTSDKNAALSIAASIATDNGFTQGVNAQTVQVNMPPKAGQFATWPNAIEVQIGSTRPSIFAGIMGIVNWPVSARAVAAILDDAAAPFAILALHETQCAAILVTGNGDITANGNIQVNSSCPTDALKRQGPGSITVNADGAACNVHGGIQDGGGSGSLNCETNSLPDDVPIVPDPLAGLPEPPMPDIAADPVQEGGDAKSIPNGCPGSSSPASVEDPAMCQFQSSYSGTTWRLWPGLYPGGIKLQGGTFYLEPGIYWLGGGGLDITGLGTATTSVDGGIGSTTYGGGVLFFNTELEGSQIGSIRLNGSTADILLRPLDQVSPDPTTWNSLVIYQDRDYPIGGDDITINGSDSDMEVRGTIYAPVGDVKVNGSAGQLTLDQIIASTFQVNGAPGSQILALNSPASVFKFTAAGLVE